MKITHNFTKLDDVKKAIADAKREQRNEILRQYGRKVFFTNAQGWFYLTSQNQHEVTPFNEMNREEEDFSKKALENYLDRVQKEIETEGLSGTFEIWYEGEYAVATSIADLKEGMAEPFGQFWCTGKPVSTINA